MTDPVSNSTDVISLTLSLPDLQIAEALLLEAEQVNPGPWVPHSRNVALAACLIAEKHPALDPERVYILGLLHDIGRQTGPNKDRHILDGYDILIDLGYPDAAQIALTHSFPMQNPAELLAWDGSASELERLTRLLESVSYTAEDRLLQLCDNLALPEGCCILEKRMVDIALRYPFSPMMIEKWRFVFGIKAEFDRAVGHSIYRLLPGIVETTLG